MRNIIQASAPVTGQSLFWDSQMQAWAATEHSWMGTQPYCLDAPDWIVTGETKFVERGLTAQVFNPR